MARITFKGMRGALHNRRCIDIDSRKKNLDRSEYFIGIAEVRDSKSNSEKLKTRKKLEDTLEDRELDKLLKDDWEEE